MRYTPLAALAALLAWHPAAAQVAPGGMAVASFDSVWSAIDRTHFDTTFNGVDWRGVRDELRPRAEAARSAGELRAVLRDMLGRLHQSHFYLIPQESQEELASEAAGPGDAGMDVRLVGGQVVVTEVTADGPAARAGIQPGWVLEQAGERDLGRLLHALRAIEEPRARELQAWSGARAALSGQVGDALAVRMRDAGNQPRTISLVLGAPRGNPTRFGNLPELHVFVDARRVPAGPATAGVIRFNLWLPALAAQLDQAVNGMRDADGIVIDLRGNVGGAGAMAMGVAGHFIDRADTLGTMRMRSATLQFVVNPRRVTAQGERVTPFAGPVAILTDATTASTSEIFAGGLQRLGRARVFGMPSAGQALPSWMKRLPSGDVLVHAIADFSAPGGARLEGTGVVPDVTVAPTRAALLGGHDPALEAALEWIAAQRRP